MNRNKIIYVPAMLIAFILSSCSCGTLQAKVNRDKDIINMQLGPFTKVQTDGGYEIELVQGDQESLTIEGKSEKLDKVKVEVENGKLRIWTEKGFHFSKIKLTIAFKNLEEFEINGGVSLNARGTIKINTFKLNIAGGASVNLPLEGNKVDLVVSGGTSIELSGKVKEANLMLQGAGSISASKLEAEKVDVEIAGAGNAKVFATKVLKAKISGVGAIDYKGNPADVNKEISGIGSISKND